MFISISKAAKLIGVSISTMRRWESENYLLPNFRTLGRHRRYCKRHLKESFLGKDYNDRINVGYARVSSHDQKDDLQRQANTLSSKLEKQFTDYIVIKDLGSGLKTNKPGLRKLLKLLLLGRVNKLVLSHKDRLLRFGSNLIFEICDFMGTKLEILNLSEEKSFEVELSEDVISIMTVSCARLYGKRAHMNKKAA